MKTLLSLCIAAMVCSPIAAQVTNGLVGYISFDSTFTPNIGNATPQLTNTVLGEDQCGNGNMALQGGPQQHYGIQDSLLAPDSDFSMCYWFNTTITNSSEGQYTVTQRHDENAAEQIGIDGAIWNYGRLVTSFRTANAASLFSLRSDTNSILPNQWYQTCATRSGDNYKLYVDGIAVDSASQTGFYLAGYINVGAVLQGPQMEPFRELMGKIDEVRLYNRVLTAAEMDTLVTTFYCESEPDTTTGIAGLGADRAVRLFPNPSNGSFNVELQHPATVTVISALGQVVLKQRVSEQLNAVQLPEGIQGVFWVRVQQDGMPPSAHRIVIAQ